MIDLSDQLRAAAGAPPPTRINLDSLIATEVRRRRNLRWAGGSAAFAAVAALAVAVPLALGGGRADHPGVNAAAVRDCPTAGAPGPQQSHATPRPTERCAAAVARLDAALDSAIRTIMPTADVGRIGFVYVPARLRYDATVTLATPAGGDTLRVELIASHEQPSRAQAGCLPRCDYERDPGGTIVVATQDERQRQVQVYRPDGTAVLLLAYPTTTAGGARPTVTLAEATLIARNPGLTLFPAAPPEPTIPAAPTPGTGPQDAVVARLNAALGAELTAAVPGATFTDPVASARVSAPSFAGSRASGYSAGVDITDADGTSHLSVAVLAQRPPCADPPNCERLPHCPMVDEGTRCEVAPDGTIRLLMSSLDGAARSEQVELHRPDGSIVQLSLNNLGPWPSPGGSGLQARCAASGGPCGPVPAVTVTRRTLPLTIDQLVEIGDALRL